MTQVIENIELLKKLAPYLEDMETEFIIHEEYGNVKNNIFTNNVDIKWNRFLKTLTLEEAIELLLNEFGRAGFTKKIEGDEDSLKFPYGIYIGTFGPGAQDMCGFKTKIEAIEEILDYLIDNNLLGTNTKN